MRKKKKYDVRIYVRDGTISAQFIRRGTSKGTTVEKERSGFVTRKDGLHWAKNEKAAFLRAKAAKKKSRTASRVELVCAGGCHQTVRVRPSVAKSFETWHVGCGKCVGWEALRGPLCKMEYVNFPLFVMLCESLDASETSLVEYVSQGCGAFDAMKVRVATKEEQASIARAKSNLMHANPQRQPDPSSRHENRSTMERFSW